MITCESLYVFKISTRGSTGFILGFFFKHFKCRFLLEIETQGYYSDLVALYIYIYLSVFFLHFFFVICTTTLSA